MPFILDGVRLLPLSELADRYQELEKDQPYYVICKSGRRSARACQFLEEQGYDVTNVQGGMDAFESLRNGSGKELLKIKKVEKVPQTFSIFPPP